MKTCTEEVFLNTISVAKGIKCLASLESLKAVPFFARKSRRSLHGESPKEPASLSTNQCQCRFITKSTKTGFRGQHSCLKFDSRTFQKFTLPCFSERNYSFTFLCCLNLIKITPTQPISSSKHRPSRPPLGESPKGPASFSSRPPANWLSRSRSICQNRCKNRRHLLVRVM